MRITTQGLEITTNVGCINNCRFCPQDKLLKAYTGERMMSMETFITCIEKLPERVNIHFSGMSEPWLNPRCTDMLLYAHNKGHKIIVATTLIGMTPNDIDRIKDIVPRRFMLHLPCDEEIENIQVDDNYLDTLRALLKANFFLDILVHGERLEPKVWRVVDEFPGAGVVYKPVCSRAGQVSTVPKIERKSSPFICKRGLLQNVLLPNGDVVICCNDYSLNHIIGNLLRDDYESIHKSDEFHRVELSMTDDSIDVLCHYCEGAIIGQWIDEWIENHKQRS